MTETPSPQPDSANPPATRTLVNRIVIRASMQDVWDELTTPGQPMPFFFNSVLHTPGHDGLDVGVPMRMRTQDEKYTAVVGEIVEFDPPRRYVTTFRFTQLDDPWCKVVYELKEVDDGTEFTLTVDELPTGTKTEKWMSQGADYILKTLKAVAEDEPLPFKSKFILCMCKLTAWMTPKRCRSEHWA